MNTSHYKSVIGAAAVSLATQMFASAFDVTDDPDNRVELGVNKEKYRTFAKQCLSGVATP